ncbi:MAG: GNAT family N-acetyltransferase [Myxococcota bacterium]
MPVVSLRPLTELELDEYLSSSKDNFTNEKVRAEGVTVEEARVAFDRSISAALPLGLRSENQFLFRLRDAHTDERVGLLWFAVKTQGPRRFVWIYDIVIDEAVRGRGYGEAAMSALEREAANRGASSIDLHVFGHNTGARRLYEKMGYRPTNLTMRKDLA